MPDYVIGREDFSIRLAEELNCKYRPFRHLYHPDGEPAHVIKADYEELDGKNVVLVLRGVQLPDYTRVSRNLHNFSRHIGNLKHMFKVEKLDVLMPYYWLGRQDKNPRDDEDPLVRERDQGRDVGYEWLARDFKAQGADRVLTFNPHFKRKKGTFEIEGLEIVSLSGVPALARYVEKLYTMDLITKNSIIAGPDFGSSPLLEEFSEYVDKDFELIEKKRVDETRTESVEGTIDAHGRDVILLDDIFSTLGTMKTAINSIKNPGKIDCFAVHAVLPKDGFERVNRLKNIVRRFAATDTIDSDYSQASVIPEVVEYYKSYKVFD